MFAERLLPAKSLNRFVLTPKHFWQRLKIAKAKARR